MYKITIINIFVVICVVGIKVKENRYRIDWIKLKQIYRFKLNINYK